MAAVSVAVRAALEGHRQEDVAGRVGVTQATIARWANPKSPDLPNVYKVRLLEWATGRPVGFIYEKARLDGVSGGVRASLSATSEPPRTDS